MLRPSAFKLSLVVALVFAAIRWNDRASAAGDLPVLRTLEHAFSDLRFRERLALAPPDPPRTTVVVAVDEKSIDEGGGWPWPRTQYARVIDQLDRAGAAAVAFDVAFFDDAAATDALADAVRRSGRTVQAIMLLGTGEIEHLTGAQRADQLGRLGQAALGTSASLSGDPGAVTLTPLSVPDDLEVFPAVQAPLPSIAHAGSWFGYFNTRPDDDAVIRSVPLAARVAGSLVVPSLDLAAAALACGAPGPSAVDPLADTPQSGRISGVAIGCAAGTLDVPLHDGGWLAADYTVPWAQIPRLSAIDVARGAFSAAFVRGKVAVVAATANGTHDLRSTPLDSDVPGGVVHATIVDQILRRRFLRRPDWAIAVELAVIAGIGLGFGLAFASLALPWTLAALGAGLAAWHGASYLFFTHGLELCTALPLLELLTLFPVAIGWRYLTEEREKRFIRRAFRHYLTASVMEAVLADPSRLSLGGEKRELTVLFSDIRGFTGLSERLAPEKLVALLNGYLTPMTELVFENGGTLDKYMGDAIMAFYGAPVEQPDHALRACRTACQMLDRLAALREGWAAEGLPPLDIGIGISTGPMVVGNMGSRERFDYTVMGDAVNLGSRLEGANKLYGTRILLSEATHALVRGQVVTRELDRVRVKGKAEPVRIYELIAVGAPPAPFAAAGGPGRIAGYEAALRSFREGRFDEAAAALEALLRDWPEDVPTARLLERVRALRGRPLPAGWDGVTVLETK